MGEATELRRGGGGGGEGNGVGGVPSQGRRLTSHPKGPARPSRGISSTSFLKSRPCYNSSAASAHKCRTRSKGGDATGCPNPHAIPSRTRASQLNDARLSDTMLKRGGPASTETAPYALTMLPTSAQKVRPPKTILTRRISLGHVADVHTHTHFWANRADKANRCPTNFDDPRCTGARCRCIHRALPPNAAAPMLPSQHCYAETRPRKNASALPGPMISYRGAGFGTKWCWWDRLSSKSAPSETKY